MNEPNYQDYYVRRAATSRNLADRAANPAIAAIHAELATRYDLLVAQGQPKFDDMAITLLQAT